MAAGDFVRLSGPVNSKLAGASLAIPVAAAGHAAGNTVVVGATHTANGTLASVSDSKGNTYTEILNSTGTTPRAGMWFSVLSTPLVSGDTITVTYGVAQNRGQVAMAAEFEGAATLQTPGVFNTGESAAPSSGDKTPSSAPAVAVGWIAARGEGGDLAVDGSWLLVGYDNSGTVGTAVTNVQALMERQALASTSPVAATGTMASEFWWAGIAVFTFAPPPPGVGPSMAIPLMYAQDKPFARTSWGAFGPGWLWVEGSGGPVDITLGTATEVETANPITPSIPRDVVVGQAVETEVANPIVPVSAKFVGVGTATETETANPVTPSNPREVVLGTATETETAGVFTPVTPREVVLGTATEAETAGTITPVKPIVVTVGTAVETETASPITPVIAREVVVGVATERELAGTMIPVKPIFVDLGVATERELARTITPVKSSTATLGPAVCDIIYPTATCAVLMPVASCSVLTPTAVASVIER